MTQAVLTLDALKEALKQGDIKDYSQHFNENKQSAFQARTFGRLRFFPQVAQKLFVPLLASIPFDPFTGEISQEGYNMRKPFRPDVEPRVLLSLIKQECNQNEKLKKHYMDMAGFNGEWDTSKEDFTDADRAILFIYRRPMAVTQAAIKINSQAITGSKYNETFLLPTKQNAVTGEYEGDISKLHRLGLLSGNLARNERNSFNQAIEENTTNCLSMKLNRHFLTVQSFAAIKSVDAEDARTIRSQISSSYALGNVSPLTVMPMIAIDVTPIKGEHKTFVTINGNDEEQLLPQFRKKIEFESSMIATDKYTFHDKVNSVIGNYFPKDPSKKKERNAGADVYPNFAVLEYITDNEATSFASDQERNLAAQKMEAKVERAPLFDRRKGWVDEGLEEFMSNMNEFYEFIKRDNFLERMPQLLLSNYKTATESIEEKAEHIFSEQYPYESYKELYTPEILATHAEIIGELFPESFAEVLDEMEQATVDGELEFDRLVAESSEVQEDDLELLVDDDGLTELES